MRRLLAAAALAALILPAVAPAVHAECMAWPMRATDRPVVRYAFTATVTDTWRDPQRVDNGSRDFDWRNELAVERSYRGHVPDRIVANGWYAGCHYLNGHSLNTGDRIFVASSDFQLHADGLEPLSVVDGQTLMVWKRLGSRWEFFAEGLDFGSDKAYYPREARTATTTADILALISSSSAPETATLSAPDRRDGSAVVMVLALAFTAGLLLAFLRLRPLVVRHM